MPRRTPQQSRILGLWTAAWLFVLLLAGILRVGDLSVQWPVLAVPVLWALVALRPRRGRDADRRPARRPAPDPRSRTGRRHPRDTEPWHADPRDAEPWDDEPWPPPSERQRPPPRPLPPTRELPSFGELPPLRDTTRRREDRHHRG